MNDLFSARTAFGIVILSLSISGILTSGFILFLQNNLGFSSFWPGTLILGEFLLILPLLIFLTKKTVNIRQTLRLNKVPARILALTAVVSVGVVVWTDEFDRLITRLFPLPTWTEDVIELLRADNPVSLIFLFCGTVLLAAASEEILFRGFLQHVLEKYWKDVTRAVLITSLFFAFIHLTPSWIIQIYLLAMVMGYLAWRTDSVFPSMILHGLNNGFAFVFLNWGGHFEPWYVWRGHVSPIILTGGAALTIFGFKRLAVAITKR